MKASSFALALLCVFLCTLSSAQSAVQEYSTEEIDEMYRKAEYYDFKIKFKKAAKWYRKAAELGHASAQRRLGDYYAYGHGGLKEDHEEAVKWYRKAADQGNDDAIYKLAKCYQYGDGIPQDFAEAMRLYIILVRQGGSDPYNYPAWAEEKIGYLYEHGLGVPKDYEMALKWYRASLARGYKSVQSEIDRLQNWMAYEASSKQQAQPQPQSQPKPQQAKAPAPQKQMTAEEMFELSQKCYQENNYTECARWCFKAAEAGYPLAQCVLGAYYLTGVIVESQDFDEAIKWFRKASQNGLIAAEHMLGYVFVSSGRAESFNYDKAVAALTRVAKQGDAFAQNALGNYYNYDIVFNFQDGKGVTEPNYAEAKKWYLMAANQGYVPAQINMHFFALADFELLEALEWLDKLKISGDAYAEEIVADWYNTDFDNYEESKELYLKAIRHGSQNAALKYCDILVNNSFSGFDANSYAARAQGGEQFAQFVYGRYLEYKRNSDGLSWIKKAADNGYAPALYHLGKHYSSGEKQEDYYLDAASGGKCQVAVSELVSLWSKKDELLPLFVDFLWLYIPRVNVGTRYTWIGAQVLDDFANEEWADAQYLIGIRSLSGYSYRGTEIWPKRTSQGTLILYEAAQNGSARAQEAINRYGL